MTSNKVIKKIKELRSDCSTGANYVPGMFNKQEATDLASPVTDITDISIEAFVFLFLWKIARISPIPKVERPTVESSKLSVKKLLCLVLAC